MFRLRPAVFCLVCLPLLASASDHGLNLDTVVVHGSSLEETLPTDLSRYGAELWILDREVLDRSGVSDVGQALQGSVPGLFVSPRAGRGDYASVSLQGSRSEDVLWLVDGVRINNRLFGDTSPLDSISTHMIERIEVLKGGQGLFYGTQAVAGVVNIVLRKPGPESGGSMSGAVGSLGDRRLGGHVRGSDALGHWIVFAEQDQSEGYQPYRDEAYQENARRLPRGFNRTSYGGRYHLPLGQDQSLNLLFLRNDVRADFPRPVANFESFNDRSEHILSLKWDQQLSERTGYFLKAYWHEWWTDYTRLSLDQDGQVDVINDRDPWGFDDQGINLTARHITESGSELLGGLDYQRYQGEDFVLRIDGKAEAVAAAFVQYRPRLSFSPDSRLAVGARFNRSDFGGDQSIWNLSFAQPLPGHLELTAGAGSNFRLPSAFELFVVDEDFPAGNEDLSPEESLNFNLAVSGPLGLNAQWQVGGFYREIQDLISVADGMYINSERSVRVRGGEATLTVGGQTGWSGDLNLTWADAREKGQSQQIDGIPEWFINARVAWNAPQYGWQLQARHTGSNTSTLADFGPQQYGDFTVLDASAWRAFGAHGEHRLTVRLENLLDHRYASGVSQAMTPDGGPFQYETLGPPRNLQLAYGRRF
ncbi:outer membrane cobalamin receptor [Natronospira proteinivora]|uniref:Outer membrane cobalamin receptor n=1 Tax=Natronospira proteinivora TaxID=1807133 RepID=A0ABT1G7M1_9GAMM|nr:TonB-dependent receptor [Natronospira proteinivora]MCP1726323.1 outer membrane cobalamin receptor [Natronospira proteinivora]